MGSEKRRDGTYAALASGPGGFKRAMEAALHRQPPSEPSKAGSMPSGARPAGDPSPETQPVDRGPGTEASLLPPLADVTPAYRRVLEELSAFVKPVDAHRLLARCLELEGSSPQTAIPYDLRAILVEALPTQLRKVLSRERLKVAIDALEQALVHAHQPNRVPGPPRTSVPATSTMPPG